jgi:hypothetical protein
MTFERKIDLANLISEWIDSQLWIGHLADPLFDQVCSEIEVEAEIPDFQISDHVICPGGHRSVRNQYQGS